MSSMRVKLLYTIKAMLPCRIEIALRRLRAHLIESVSHDVWPICEAAGSPPIGWSGWPDNKRFAVVLTHDVESLYGLSYCTALSQIEEAHGFRSAFYFVPHRYCTPVALRDDLKARGFEIGVHGLKHDGKLFQSKKIFDQRAKSINEYLRDWGACGFRAPAMHHNLDWLRDLDILYDTSTFDTDPFQPQPDCLQRIFPLWIPPFDRRPGYVELPYTLPQDWKLFVILGKKNIDIWKRKIDWIAQKGGMLLLLTHPDYMRFNGGRGARACYPLEFYESLLRYLAERYKDEYWHPLPRDMAKFWAALPSKHQDYDAWARVPADGVTKSFGVARRIRAPRAT